MKSRLTATAAVFAVLVFAFAAGFTLLPAQAEACYTHPSCGGCADVYKGCSCGLSGDRWEVKTTCRDSGTVVEWSCSYVCGP
jgi:hypothetical protein